MLRGVEVGQHLRAEPDCEDEEKCLGLSLNCSDVMVSLGQDWRWGVLRILGSGQAFPGREEVVEVQPIEEMYPSSSLHSYLCRYLYLGAPHYSNIVPDLGRAGECAGSVFATH